MTAAPSDHVHAGRQSLATTNTLPERYVRIPQRLLTSALYRPLQIGIYSLAARLFLVAKAPVPLSAADILRYDPALSRGAAQRALTNLVAGGWLLATEHSGQKTAYVPAWGRVHGAPLPWKIGALCLDRPRHIRAVCLDLRLLDLFLGKLTPQPLRAAVITRYVTAPLLALADVGSYALLLAGLPGATPNLIAWNLTRDEQPLPLPSDAAILARASQRRLFDQSDPTLTARGLQKAGLNGPPAAAESAQPLFFVPPELIATWPSPTPSSLIDQIADAETHFTAAQSQPTPSAASSPAITWESVGTTRTQTESTPNPHMAIGGGGVGTNNLKTNGPQAAQLRPAAKTPKVSRPIAPLPDTEVVRALIAINVLPEQIAELADTPLAVVNAAIRDGQARPAIRDLAGWVVTLIRAHRDQGWKIQPPPPRAESPAALRAAFADYATQQESERSADPPAPADPAQLQQPSAPEQLWDAVQAALRSRISRAEFNAHIRRVSLLSVACGVATIVAPGALVKQAIEDRYFGMLRELLRMHAGEALELRVILNSNAQEQAAARTAQAAEPGSPIAENSKLKTQNSKLNPPAWITAERWAALPVMLRAALAGAELVDGIVQARSPYLGQLLATRFAREVQALIAENERPTLDCH